MENSEKYLMLLCTIGVVCCGLTVIIAATAQVVRATLKQFVPTPNEEPVDGQEPVRPKRRRKREDGDVCQCGTSLTSVPTSKVVMVDDMTMVVKECPDCLKENVLKPGTGPLVFKSHEGRTPS